MTDISMHFQEIWKRNIAQNARNVKKYIKYQQYLVLFIILGT